MRGMIEHLERARRSRTGRRRTTLVVVEHDARAVGELGLDGGAQDAAAVEATERPLLLDDLAGHERHAEQLAVRMGSDAPASRPWFTMACV